MMADRPTQGEQLDTIIDHGVRSLVERNAPPGHAYRIRARVAAVGPTLRSGEPHLERSRWLQPALVTGALLVAAVGVGVWAVRESSDDILETRVVRHVPLQPPSAMPPVADLRSAVRRDVQAMHAEPSPRARASVEVSRARAAREAEASRAKLMAYLEALHQLPPEVLLREPPSAAEPLPEPTPIVIPEIVITPLDARAGSEDETSRGDFLPRGDE